MTRIDDNDPLRPRRRFSAWTLLAPVALLVFVFAAFNAIGESCVVKHCAKPASKSSAKDDVLKSDKPPTGGKKPSCLNTPKLCPRNAKYTVKEGDNASVIADRFQLSQDDLSACNPNADIVSLPVGTKLFISPARCKGADLAKPGANPDPFSDETSVVPDGQ